MNNFIVVSFLRTSFTPISSLLSAIALDDHWVRFARESPKTGRTGEYHLNRKKPIMDDK